MNPFATQSTLPGLSIISAMITPAILILASGNLVASTMTRLARVVDRARALIDRLEVADGRGDRQRVEFYSELLNLYRRRTIFVERALSSYYGAIGCFIITSLTIALDNFIRNAVPWLAVSLTVIGVLLLLFGTASLVFETNLATGTVQREIDASAIRRPGA